LDDMKISFLIPMLGGGGAERVTIDISKGLRSPEDSVQIVTNEIVGEFVEDAREVADLFSLETYSMFLSVVRLKSYINQQKPDTIFAQGTRMSVAASFAALFPGHRPNLVWCLHNPYSTKHSLYPKPIAWVLTKLVAFLAKQPDTIVGVSDGVCESFLDFVGQKFRPKTCTIHNPISPYVPKRVSARREDESMRIISVGRLERQKNFANLIAAMPSVAEAVPATLRIYGVGPLREALQDQIRQLDLDDRVKLMGFAEDIRDKMAESDLFVLSSIWEGLPTVLIEAMTTGVPVVATDCVSGPSEILEDGKWGKLVPENDSDALASAIVDVLKNGGVDGRPRARQFEPENIIKKYRVLLQEIESGKFAGSGTPS